jgi:hypothetical protein
MSGLVVVAPGAGQGRIIPYHPFRRAILEECDLSDIERQSLPEVRDNSHIGNLLDALPPFGAPALAASVPSVSRHNLTVL